jgi:two-component system KDP operon response regulator KdpE
MVLNAGTALHRGIGATTSALVVSGDENAVSWLEAVLATNGLDTIRAESGRQALASAVDLDPNIILVVAPLPDQDGPELCHYLRGLTEAPIIVLAHDALESDVVRTLDQGADEFLLSPLRPQELAARLRALLRRANGCKAQSGDGRMVIGDLVVCLDEHRVYRKGQLVDLTPTEFTLLVCLAREPGRLITHRKLIAQVWGGDCVDCTHYLRLYIGYLRSKLEDDPKDPKMILNEWGIGYRLVAPSSQGS